MKKNEFDINLIYKMQNRRKKTYIRIGDIITDIYRGYQTNESRNHFLHLKNIRDKYNIDERTIKKYLKEYIFDIGRNKVIIFNDIDNYVIESSISQLNIFNSLDQKHKKIAKYITYSSLSKKTG